jgi:Fic family protein
MRRFIWQDERFPAFSVDHEVLVTDLDRARRVQSTFLGALSHTPEEVRLASTVDNLTATAIETSAIEGESLDARAVRSSVARRLGADVGAVRADDRTEGVVAMTLDAVQNGNRLLTTERLFEWHAGLFPIAKGGHREPWMGAYRSAADDPMQILSGPAGRERVHIEAPPAAAVPPMIERFLEWFNGGSKAENGLIRAAVAHLWFETLHPFVDGNGRIGRAIADMALAQDEQSADRFYSLSAAIARQRNSYYDAIEAAQHGSLDITPWVRWFLNCLMSAIDDARSIVDRARTAACFWSENSDHAFNERQRRVLWRFLGNFEGNLNLRKYIALAGGTPRATAQRDIAELVDAGILEPVGQGRATSYALAQQRPRRQP